MVKSMYAAIAGLRSHQSKMDVISNNIANVNTWGYKSRTANFQDAMYQNLTNSTGGNVDTGGLGGKNSSQLGYGVNVGSVSTNFTTGSWGYTGDPLNCMLNQNGFFIVGPMTEQGDAGISSTGFATQGFSLTRVGIFTVDNNGYLVDDSQNYVYGFKVDDVTGEADRTQLIPLKTPAGVTIETYRIGTDGTVTGISFDKKQHIIGKIAVAAVENPNGLEQSAGYLYNVGDNAGDVTAIEGDKFVSNYLEMSNVELASDMASMITTQRGYQANSKIITVTDEMLEQLVNMKR